MRLLMRLPNLQKLHVVCGPMWIGRDVNGQRHPWHDIYQLSATSMPSLKQFLVTLDSGYVFTLFSSL